MRVCRYKVGVLALARGLVETSVKEGFEADLAKISSFLKAFENNRIERSDESLKRAAVRIPLCSADGRFSVALIERAANMRNHGGQWGFPGGRIDGGETVLDAAFREFCEELDLDLPRSRLIGRLDDFVTRSGYIISPVVVWMGDIARVRPNPDEIARVFSVPVDQLLKRESVEWFFVADSENAAIRIAMHGDYLYAPSAALLYQFRELALGRVTRVAEIEQPQFARR